MDRVNGQKIVSNGEMCLGVRSISLVEAEKLVTLGSAASQITSSAAATTEGMTANAGVAAPTPISTPTIGCGYVVSGHGLGGTYVYLPNKPVVRVPLVLPGVTDNQHSALGVTRPESTDNSSSTDDCSSSHSCSMVTCPLDSDSDRSLSPEPEVETLPSGISWSEEPGHAASGPNPHSYSLRSRPRVDYARLLRGSPVSKTPPQAHMTHDGHPKLGDHSVDVTGCNPALFSETTATPPTPYWLPKLLTSVDERSSRIRWDAENGRYEVFSGITRPDYTGTVTPLIVSIPVAQSFPTEARRIWHPTNVHSNLHFLYLLMNYGI